MSALFMRGHKRLRLSKLRSLTVAALKKNGSRVPLLYEQGMVVTPIRAG